MPPAVGARQTGGSELTESSATHMHRQKIRQTAQHSPHERRTHAHAHEKEKGKGKAMAAALAPAEVVAAVYHSILTTSNVRSRSCDL